MMFREITGRNFEGIENKFERTEKFDGPNIDPNAQSWRPNKVVTEEMTEKEELLYFLKDFGHEWQVTVSPKTEVEYTIVRLCKDRKRSLNFVLNKYANKEFLYIYDIIKDIMDRNLDPIQVLTKVVELTNDNDWVTVLSVAQRYVNER